MGSVQYYISPSGENPISDFLDTLKQNPQAKLLRIFKYIELYGLQSILPHVKKLTGTPLWEIRILGRDNIRVFYIIFAKDEILALHGFVKKSKKAPKGEISIAISRYEEWTKRIDI